ncbi:MAG: hypothetical protein H6937_07230 [Burkholderiales bacterium]|nr:hypothetical protein [Burkholderiales bacterium]
MIIGKMDMDEEILKAQSKLRDRIECCQFSVSSDFISNIHGRVHVGLGKEGATIYTDDTLLSLKAKRVSIAIFDENDELIHTA